MEGIVGTCGARRRAAWNVVAEKDLLMDNGAGALQRKLSSKLLELDIVRAAIVCALCMIARPTVSYLSACRYYSRQQI